MSKYTPEQTAASARESERLLKPPQPAAPRPEPVREVSLPPFEDEVERWKREADEQEARFAAERAEQQRQEAHAARANWSAWNEYVDGRIAAALAERQHEIVELARGTVEFANAVDSRLVQLEQLLTKLSATHAAMRALDDVRRGETIDMPSPIIRRTRVN